MSSNLSWSSSFTSQFQPLSQLLTVCVLSTWGVYALVYFMIGKCLKEFDFWQTWLWWWGLNSSEKERVVPFPIIKKVCPGFEIQILVIMINKIPHIVIFFNPVQKTCFSKVEYFELGGKMWKQWEVANGLELENQHQPKVQVWVYCILDIHCAQ